MPAEFDSSVPVFTYHGIGDKRSPLYVCEKSFDRQMRALAEAGYQSVALESALFAESEGSGKICVITFDDCFESVYTKAWPILRNYGFTATLFVVTDYCGSSNRWPSQPAGVPETDLMSWKQILFLAEQGYQVGAHTKTHPDLTSLSLEQAEEEILGSKQAIEKALSTDVSTFAFPYGLTNSGITQLVKKHYDCAVGTDLAIAGTHTDLYNISRVDSYYAAPFLLQRISSPSSKIYLDFRNRLRKVRRLFQPDAKKIYQPQDRTQVKQVQTATNTSSNNN